jgi:hypothetical protein
MRSEASGRVPWQVLWRVVEIGVGILVAVAGLVPLVLVVGVFVAPFEVPYLGMAVVAVPVAWWCGRTAWSLFSGRERKRGGLLSPTVLFMTTGGLVALACYGVLTYGVKGSGQALYLGWLAAGTGAMGWARLRAKRRDRDA